MSADQGQIIPPGSTIGILGGGQLGRMTAMAAARLGYRVHSYCPEADSPAFQVSAASSIAAYDDPAALSRFADAVDVVTFEFENVPSATTELLAARKPTRPGPNVLHVAQHQRLRARESFCVDAENPKQFRQFVRGMRTLPDQFIQVGGRNPQLARDPANCGGRTVWRRCRCCDQCWLAHCLSVSHPSAHAWSARSGDCRHRALRSPHRAIPSSSQIAQRRRKLLILACDCALAPIVFPSESLVNELAAFANHRCS